MSRVLVDVDSECGVVTVTLNEPKRGNPVHPAVFSALSKALDEAEADPVVKCVIITGAGPFFSTGGDVRALMKSGDEVVDALQNFVVPFTQKLIDFPKLLVAVLNGPAVGYSALMLGLFDLVLACNRTAYLNLPFFHIGLSPEGAGSLTLLETVGHQTTTDWLATARRVPIAELIKSGLVTRLIDSSDAKEYVAKFVSEIPLSSVLAAKRLLRSQRNKKSLSDQNKLEFSLMSELFLSGVPRRMVAARYKIAKSKM